MTGGTVRVGVGVGTSYASRPCLVEHQRLGPVVVLAFGVSAIAGLAFGVCPALQAARLQPVDAVRYE